MKHLCDSSSQKVLFWNNTHYYEQFNFNNHSFNGLINDEVQALIVLRWLRTIYIYNLLIVLFQKIVA